MPPKRPQKVDLQTFNTRPISPQRGQSPRRGPTVEEECIAFATKYMELYDDYVRAGGPVPERGSAARRYSFDHTTHNLLMFNDACRRFLARSGKDHLNFVFMLRFSIPESLWAGYDISANEERLIAPIRAHMMTFPRRAIDEYERREKDSEAAEKEAAIKREAHEAVVNDFRNYVNLRRETAKREVAVLVREGSELSDECSNMDRAIAKLMRALKDIGILDHRDTRRVVDHAKSIMKTKEDRLAILRADILNILKPYHRSVVVRMHELGLDESDKDVSSLIHWFTQVPYEY